jgi:NAD(P)-dependent dehydrogenase (short-subunit alcohol dehydrogenase family)
MNIDLSGKTAIVTGSTAGIGLTIAKGLATAGVKVVVNGRTEGATGRSLDEVAAAFVAAQRPSSIIRRPASAEEVANMVVYAASPQASATTGAALRVDGGVVDTIA